MLYALLSDVHGNMDALESVLDHLEQLPIDRYAFLGDAVGYGAEPNQVCNALRSRLDIAIVGNHDAAVSGRMNYGDYYEAARQALDWCSKQLSDKNRAWLRSLPYKHREGFLEFSHGAPLAPEMFDYLFTPEQVIDLLDAVDELADVTFIGHSHLTISFKIEADTVTPIMAPEIHCEPGAKYIITVGSVGQPRDRDPRACCGTFDTDTRMWTYHRLEYDMFSTRRKILAAGLSPVFG